MNALILRLDISGIPIRWVPWQDAVSLYTREVIAWTGGESVFTFRGGISRITGRQSEVEVNSIVAVRHTSKQRNLFRRGIPPLTNQELFLRDSHLCMYCGGEFLNTELTRDHVMPVSKGGRDRWSNVVSACKQCNTRKGARTPEHARMSLLAVPYVPNWAEYLALSNRRILADQMEFLKPRFSGQHKSRLCLI
ncbi:MAG: HNH endonuclease [Candidatus Eutrophobiaceae bacterium]